MILVLPLLLAHGALTTEYFCNDLHYGPPACTAPFSNEAGVARSNLAPPRECGGCASPGSMRVVGTLSPRLTGAHWFKLGSAAGVGAARLYVDDVRLFDTGFFAPAPLPPLPGLPLTAISNVTLSAAPHPPVALRLELLPSNASSFSSSRSAANGVGAGVGAQLLWLAGDQEHSHTVVPDSALSTTVSAPQQQREALRARLDSGWNTWGRHSALAHYSLPHRVGFEVSFWNATSGAFYKGAGLVQNTHGKNVTVVPGPHTYNGSYTQLAFSPFAGVSASVESAHAPSGGAGTDTGNCVLRIKASVAGGGGVAAVNTAGLQLLIMPVRKWGAAGPVLSTTPGPHNGTTVLGTTVGALRVTVNAPTEAGPGSSAPHPGTLAIAFGSGASAALDVSVSLMLLGGDGAAPTPAPDDAAIAAFLAEQRAAAARGNSLAARPAPDAAALAAMNATVAELEEAHDAMRTVIAWNTAYDPRVGAHSPVSRTFEAQYSFLFFDWDTYFGASMLGWDADGRDLAYANVIEVTLTRSAYGFVPNKRSGNAADLPNEHETGTNKVTSNDRTEPYVGAQTLLRLHGKWGDDWLVELLFEVLLTWNQWAWRERVNQAAAALPLVQLGSDPENLPTYRSPYTGGVGTLGAAILESGMDNSPMYDGAGFDNVTHRVELYDVGMTSLFLAENRALLQLAAVVGRAAEVRALLQPQYDAVAAAMGAHLWDEASGTFANGVVADHGKGSGAARVSVGDSHGVGSGAAGAPRATELSPRLSPTAFYPLLAGVPSAAQASAMVERHLTNASEFCVSVACDFAMPSISRADDHFRDNNYWRGRTWGPLNYLVHSALSESAYTQPVEGAAGGGAALATLVNATRARLCRQGLNVLQPQWRAWRHVGENYNSTNAQICDVGNANPYYHWGALLGFTALVEAYGY